MLLFQMHCRRMLDLELNYRNSGEKWAFDVNAYRQQYRNQLVLTGAIDDQGYAIRENVGQSFRQGLSLPVRVSAVLSAFSYGQCCIESK